MDNLLDNQHGGNITAFAKEIGCQPSEVIDLSSNINFVKPNINIDFNTLDISPYPNYEELESAIATLYNVQTSELELFNGATSAIYSLLRNLEPKEATLYAPLYLEYQKALTLQNCNIHYINRFENIYEEVKEDSLVIFVNPSTPDGKFYDIDKLMKIWISKNCTILVDESFLDFTPYKSVSLYLEEYEKLYILKSMTKFYAAAGIRIGALISNKKNIQNLKKKEPLWKISQFDSHYLQEALKDKDFKVKARKKNLLAKNKLIKILEQFKYIKKIYASDSNFVLLKLQGLDAPTLQKRLMPFKIMIRDCSNFKFLNHTHIRIAIKNNQNIKALEMALQKISLFT